jgi:hypothetical protein
MALIWRACLTDNGISTTRTSTVKIIMLSPKLLKNMLYNSTRLLIIGWIIARFQMSPSNSKV